MTSREIEVEELRCAIRRREREGDGGCGMTEGLRHRLWVLENCETTPDEWSQHD